MSQPITLRQLSLTARQAVALLCLKRYCEKFGLHHQAIEAYFDDLWEYPLVDQNRWSEWHNHHPELVETATQFDMGYELEEINWPDGFVEFLQKYGQKPEQFLLLIGSITEIVFGSFYSAVDEKGSWEQLCQTLKITETAGIVTPPPSAFIASLFVDNDGWGNRITKDQRDAWRALLW
ncbi:MAG: hypothetical protein QM703_26660 [Gemmatales bacterium]